MPPVHHLDASSIPPDVSSAGKVRLYSAKWCPFSQRVLLILAHHKIEFENVFINLDNKPQWYIDKVPPGRVPLLEQDGQKLQDSEMICRFLDQLHPAESLANGSGQDAASEIWSAAFKPMHRLLYEEIDNGAEELARLGSAMDLMEERLEMAAPFLAGTSVGLADYLLYPLMERVPIALSSQVGGGATSLEMGRPRLAAWRQAMGGLASVQSSAVSQEQHEAFCAGKRAADSAAWSI